MWLERMQTEGLLEAAVVYGYFRCVSSGNDLIILGPARGAEGVRGERLPPGSGGVTGGVAPPGENTVLERFSFPRQRRDRRLCLADFFKPQARDSSGPRDSSGQSDQTDVVAFQLATMGVRVSLAAGELFAKNAYREYLELHGLSVQLTEALAEYWHARVRRELGIAGSDPEDLDGFFRVGYQGARYSFGYPACPDLADRAKVVRLLEPARIGVELSEEMQLHPEQSTDAIVLHHPEAKYFSV
jgi:5-methyltetrahydrofolate--homocysteine methyltransferase